MISDLKGLVRIAPVLAIGMTVFMVSLAGIPPTGGFWAKLFIFRAAIARGDLGIPLAVIMLVNSVVSVYYYFSVPRAMIFQDPEPGETLRPSWLVTAVVALAMVALVAFFVLPNPIAQLGELSTLTGIAGG
jgi:NADH-quinone oxidoreductase subunit N